MQSTLAVRPQGFLLLAYRCQFGSAAIIPSSHLIELGPEQSWDLLRAPVSRQVLCREGLATLVGLGLHRCSEQAGRKSEGDAEFNKFHNFISSKIAV
jgi:hypothetical protein